MVHNDPGTVTMIVETSLPDGVRFPKSVAGG